MLSFDILLKFENAAVRLDVSEFFIAGLTESSNPEILLAKAEAVIFPEPPITTGCRNVIRENRPLHIQNSVC